MCMAIERSWSPKVKCKTWSTHVHWAHSLLCSCRDNIRTCGFLNWKLLWVLTMWISHFQNRKVLGETMWKIYPAFTTKHLYACMHLLLEKGDREQTVWGILPSATCRRHCMHQAEAGPCWGKGVCTVFKVVPHNHTAILALLKYLHFNLSYLLNLKTLWLE